LPQIGAYIHGPEQTRRDYKYRSRQLGNVEAVRLVISSRRHKTTNKCKRHTVGISSL